MTTVPVTGYTWTFDPDRSDGGILVDSIDNDMPEYRPGGSYSLDLLFWTNTQDGGDGDGGGGTLGTTTGFTLGGTTGATLSTDGTLTTAIDRYEEVREYSRFAGRYSLTESIDGTPRFSEHTPADASVDSIVVQLSPGDDLTATDGLWVILDDVDDATRFPKDQMRISLDMTVLARADEYDDRAAIKSALGSDLV